MKTLKSKTESKKSVIYRGALKVRITELKKQWYTPNEKQISYLKRLIKQSETVQNF